MKTALLVIVSLLTVLLVVPATAQVSFEGHVSGIFQDIEGEDWIAAGEWEDEPQERGFSDLQFNLDITGEVAPGIDGFARVVAPFGGITAAYELYITHAALLPMSELKFGQFELPFGDQTGRRSLIADVQSNNLIGNAVTDLGAAQTGLEFSGHYQAMDWNLALTNGTTGSNFSDDRDMAITVRAGGDIFPGFRASGSFYTVSHDDPTLNNFGGPDFYANHGYRLLGTIGDISPDLSNVEELDVWQLDLTYDLGLGGLTPLELYLNYGDIDNDIGEANYLTFEGRYDLTPASYLAVRWSQIDIDPDSDDDGKVERLQVGLGHEISPGTLMKLEYVDQDVDDDLPPFIDVAKFSGILAELSVRF